MPINPTKSDVIRRGGRGSTAAWEVIGVIDTDGECAEWVFPEEPGAVRSARAAVRGQLGVWDLDSLGDVTELLVSELVTNALRHASGPIGVRLLRSAEPAHTLRVEVSDPLPDPPLERVAGPDEESGRGLQLVAGSARRWGTRPGDAGKTVWFELSLPGRH
ncbi:ATP-binding protein [Streptomyces sp. NPDC005480]|uniref:ATP-binding protein n=1 Tax=Streptomyces sp. NPDC005480 TaxID=3154880 RepID=UPI0033A9B052